MIYITLEESGHRNDLVRKAETQSPVAGMVKQFQLYYKKRVITVFPEPPIFLSWQECKWALGMN